MRRLFTVLMLSAAMAAIASIHRLLAEAFPPRDAGVPPAVNELPDAPVVL